MRHRSKRDPRTLPNVRVCSRGHHIKRERLKGEDTFAASARQDLTVVGFRHGRKNMEPEQPANESYMYGFKLGRQNKRG